MAIDWLLSWAKMAFQEAAGSIPVSLKRCSWVLIGDAVIGDVLDEGYEALQSIVDGSAQRRSLTGEYRRMTRNDNGD